VQRDEKREQYEHPLLHRSQANLLDGSVQWARPQPRVARVRIGASCGRSSSRTYSRSPPRALTIVHVSSD
jgi:hypothetical protein